VPARQTVLRSINPGPVDRQRRARQGDADLRPKFGERNPPSFDSSSSAVGSPSKAHSFLDIDNRVGPLELVPQTHIIAGELLIASLLGDGRVRLRPGSHRGQSYQIRSAELFAPACQQ
jgi:hypothetical protein